MRRLVKEFIENDARNNRFDTSQKYDNKIAGLLHEYEYVREFGEGTDRMYLEMKEAGLPEPEYRTEAFTVYATIRNKKVLATRVGNAMGSTQDNTQDRILEYCKVPRCKGEIAEFLGYKDVSLEI